MAYSSSFFVLGWFEPNPPRRLSWLLDTDLVQTIFRGLSLTPPQYRSDELQELPVVVGVPPVTGYRLLTTLSVTLFGAVKAYLAYDNRAPAKHQLDWISGTILTST